MRIWSIKAGRGERPNPLLYEIPRYLRYPHDFSRAFRCVLPPDVLHSGGLPGGRLGGAALRPAASHRRNDRGRAHRARSEEHTSELQSRRDLVCRLLLEKKKRKQTRLGLHRKKKKEKK